MNAVVRDPRVLFAAPRTLMERHADGSIVLRSAIEAPPAPRCLGEHLVRWAREAPDRTFLAERAGPQGWARLTYAQALARVERIAAWLLGQRLSAERPVLILSENGIEHALLVLAAMHVGVPAASISAAYSLMSRDHAKLASCVAHLRPGVVYADDAARYGPALAAIARVHDGVVVTSRRGGRAERTPQGGVRTAEAAGVDAVPFEALLAAEDRAAVQAAFAQVGPDSIAKFLFTSGSIGAPKAVINTQRMLCSNQEARATIWPFLAHTPPVILDWLPWSHTFGANHNFNMVLRNGGTLYIDDGKPAPGLFEKSLANLREIAPTVYFNVPRGFDMLVAALRADPSLRTPVFSRLQLMFYAGAALPQHLWDALLDLSRNTVGEPITLVSGWGSTETAPLAADCHFPAERAGVIGVPAPGCTLKLVPSGDKTEIRVRGENVTPGYWKLPEVTAAAFDEEGYYRIGDAVRFVDPARPDAGLLFDGRVAEDFKLMTGTWVNVGMLRVKGIDALKPVAQDIVVTGHDREAVGFLVFASLPECRRLASDLPADAPAATVLAHPAVRDCVARGLAALAREGGSSMAPAGALLMAEPASIDAGEITDKGYVNQRAVREHRAVLVDRLYAEPAPAEVIRPS